MVNWATTSGLVSALRKRDNRFIWAADWNSSFEPLLLRPFDWDSSIGTLRSRGALHCRVWRPLRIWSLPTEELIECRYSTSRVFTLFFFALCSCSAQNLENVHLFKSSESESQCEPMQAMGNEGEEFEVYSTLIIYRISTIIISLNWF